MNTSPINEKSKSNIGAHKRIPSYIKSIPHGKLPVSPISFDDQRKKAYEMIS
jgi:hypothetical protein